MIPQPQHQSHLYIVGLAIIVLGEALLKIGALFTGQQRLQQEQPQIPPAERPPLPPAGTNGHGTHHIDVPPERDEEPGRLTQKQLSAIRAIKFKLTWSNDDLRAYTTRKCGKMPEFLTRTEASGVIKDMDRLLLMAQEKGIR